MSEPGRLRLVPICLLTVAMALAPVLRPSHAAGENAPPDVQKLIQQLGSPEYFIRERAERELLRMGFDVFDALKAAEDDEDLEIAARAAYLARRIEIDWVREEDSDDVKQQLRGYGDLSVKERLSRAAGLAGLPGDAGLVALCRIVRYEKSQLVSKQAAIALLEPNTEDSDLWQRRAKTIEERLSASTRPAARWLRARLLAEKDRAAALDAWTRLIEAERQIATTAPGDTEPEILLSLMRRKLSLLKQLDRRDDAVALILEMIDLEQGGTETLGNLVEWLAQEKAWELIDQVAQRFAPRIDSNPRLLYTLAQARQQQGKGAQAEALAEQALKVNAALVAALNPGRTYQQVKVHVDVPDWLRDRGLFDWAEREYRSVLSLRELTSPPSLLASFHLAEMLHDSAKDGPAAKVLGDLVKVMDEDVAAQRQVVQLYRNPKSVRSRAEYFASQAVALKDDHKKQREHLERAIDHDPTDADVLIAMYRLPGADKAFQDRTRSLIKTAGEEFRRQIAQNTEYATPYNQYSWLIGNTEGDLDEAIRFSHKSIELYQRRTGKMPAGYLDTLAHCYYTKGDYKSAVKYQQQAVELEPHTQVIRRQLAVFKKALAESLKKEKGNTSAK